MQVLKDDAQTLQLISRHFTSQVTVMNLAFTSATMLVTRQRHALAQTCQQPTRRSPRRVLVKSLANQSEGPLERLTRRVTESYRELEPGQQLYVQVLYITLVVSIMLSVSATALRIYNTFRIASHVGW